MEILLVLPVLIPLFSAIIMIFLAGKPRTHRAVNFAGSLAQLIASIFLLGHVYISGIEVMFVGSWPAPYGITLVADMLSAVMVLISGIIGFVTSVYSLSAISPEKQKFFYFPLLQILLMGINGSFITGDIFNLFVWFEVMLISSFVLLALGGKQEQLEGAMKYVTLNLISSAIFLAAVGILFGIAGTLNMADLAVKIKTIENPGLINIVSMMFLISFGIKSAIFPLFFWLPASYHTPPSAVSAIFAGMLTKVGVYAMIRMFSLIFTHNVEFTHSIILILAGFTMVTGVFGAAAQNNFRRILSFHIISQIGYMIMGLGLFTPLAIAGSIFYIVHHIIFKTNLFFISGIIYHIKGSYQLKELGGVYKAMPLLGLLYLVPALSLAGMPPLSGFWSKFLLAKAGFEAGQFLIVAVSLFVGLMTLFSMTKIWNEVFWKDFPKHRNDKGSTQYSRMHIGNKIALVLPSVVLAIITITIGIYPEPFFNISESAAEQLLNTESYIEAVLKGAN